ncbi:proline-rich proteoglycan 2-like [Ornithorhynchus anatinus]|uniref:proline-rich proteoglycan 2-like n=1 Tax=Ornithorhynchus anatinus TaxID=9258 RepID=UPI0019D4D464|nr:proline-rich proteoglycan 2-like [Ornithorhynchus anatinus]
MEAAGAPWRPRPRARLPLGGGACSSYIYTYIYIYIYICTQLPPHPAGAGPAGTPGGSARRPPAQPPAWACWSTSPAQGTQPPPPTPRGPPAAAHPPSCPTRAPDKHRQTPPARVCQDSAAKFPPRVGWRPAKEGGPLGPSREQAFTSLWNRSNEKSADGKGAPRQASFPASIGCRSSSKLVAPMHPPHHVLLSWGPLPSIPK